MPDLKGLRGALRHALRTLTDAFLGGFVNRAGGLHLGVKLNRKGGSSNAKASLHPSAGNR